MGTTEFARVRRLDMPPTTRYNRVKQQNGAKPKEFPS